MPHPMNVIRQINGFRIFKVAVLHQVSCSTDLPLFHLVISLFYFHHSNSNFKIPLEETGTLVKIFRKLSLTSLTVYLSKYPLISHFIRVLSTALGPQSSEAHIIRRLLRCMEGNL
jgi:hypothetical protein